MLPFLENASLSMSENIGPLGGLDTGAQGRECRGREVSLPERERKERINAVSTLFPLSPAKSLSLLSCVWSPKAVGFRQF